MASPADGLRDEIVGLLPRLRRFARVLARQPADADDLVQIVVERALMRIDQFQPGTRLDAWLFAMTRNAWIDETRSRARRSRVFAPEGDGVNVGADGARTQEYRLDAMDMASAMAALPEEQRTAIALVCIEGFAYREAAETMGVPIGTLTSRLARGRETLEKMLGGAS
ncbi:MAG: sigma-70 family RNA polymerase sigma factor [Hyphomonadaceae bacterium]|nr:MAG: RNA polymerase sigma-70 factor ECF subfamily [Caulobacteraceae bacterium]MBT9447695.1 sigma-70 family RNA polymerase sigma factor [Hyphomonadaceae bacterium]TPW06808.1 MAG: RNA polymerase sigma-70 factor, ECF subfamily [Alphaproteobacteria bacterium]